jgi:8-amino-3,8-dideoxy-alpha-D-manno-octulosonate transaminase
LADIGCFSFDFAKTITTGEGGMVVTNSKQLIEKAKAYHDHGHENNPKLPRWEDSRVSSGFNFRMSELQAAVGIAQLKKLNWIVDSQRKNAESILNKVSEIGVTGIKPRVSPAASFETFDAVVFRSEIVPAREVRDALLKFSISTKILPEATTWHFAGDWDHLEFIQKSKLKDKKFLEISRNLLSKHFAIPNFVYLPQGFLSNLEKAFLALREKYGA